MPTILLIEDDDVLRRALRLFLEKDGNKVIDASDGRQGIAAAIDHEIHLVITDMLMPEVEGVQTIIELRKINPNLPVFAMSGGGRVSPTSYLTLASKLGAKRVFEKPFEPEDLCAAVRDLMGSKGVSRLVD